MSRGCCRAREPSGPRRAIGRGIALAEWAGPAAVLALLPKCPLCLAAYVAFATGIGMSVAAATYLRTGLVVLSVALLALAAARRAVRFWAA